MPDVVIRTEGLSKIYPLVASTRRRLLYVLGFEKSGGDAVPTKSAVDAIDLEIRRGEKVGIIGRNGSGKSTLLGMISGTIEPSRGRLSVTGDVHALLQLGAGFNEELTGRENANSYLALQGVSGRQARGLVARIAEFAEIGVYFDQPVKTYSSGMRLRLMFAAATSISPDVLVLDEVLSVGDAYFIGKSFERMRDLCAGEGTTLIVVSHAVNMLPELCDRIIWLDNGAIRMDGEPETVARAYDAFIRTEEENRLRKLQATSPVRQLTALPDDGATVSSGNGAARPDRDELPASLVGEIRLPDGQPPGHRLIVQRLEFWQGGVRVADIPVGAGSLAGDAVLLVEDGAGNWGPFEETKSGTGRSFLAYGSPFHKLPFLVTTGELRAALDAGGVEVRLTCTSANEDGLEVALHADDPLKAWYARLVVQAGERAGTATGMLAPREDIAPGSDERLAAATTGRFGTRRIELTDIDFLDETDRVRLVFSIGAPFRVRMRFRVNDPALDENAEVVVAFQKDGLQVTHRFFLNEYRFCASARREGEILLDATPLLLAPGEYAVSVAVHAAGHATRKTPREHFAVSRTVYDMYYRCFHITVFEPYHTTLLRDVIFQHPAIWLVDSEEYQKTALTD